MTREDQPRRSQTAAEFKEQYDPDEKIRHLKDELARAEKDFTDYKKEVGGLRLLFDSMKESIEALEPPQIEYRRPRKSQVSAPVVHACHWTDWHMGAVQDAEEIEGFNEFNPSILREYLTNCVHDQLEWVELHRKSYTIDTCHNLCTGDYISGGIHPELLWTNEYPEPVQAIRAGELLAELVAMQAPHYAKVVVDFITVDNHARLTKKPQASEAGINTWNYCVGYFAKERLRNLQNVEFNIHEAIFKVVNCGGRRYLITHGDRVRGWAGFPWYGLDRLVGREAVKRIRRILEDSRRSENKDRTKEIGHIFDRVVLGHWHAPLEHPWYLIGGSACGTTTYDHGEGRSSDPIQCAWMVHPLHGEFDRTNWRLRRNTA